MADERPDQLSTISDVLAEHSATADHAIEWDPNIYAWVCITCREQEA